MEGIIRKALSGFYYVDDGTSLTACRGRGKLRHAKVTPLVGDRVEFTPLDNGQGAIDAILPRKNQFQRPAVANIDQLVIVASQAIPVTDPFLIDRVIAIAEGNHCESIVCVNKCDLASGGELAALGLEGPAIGAAQRRLAAHILSHPEDNTPARLLALARAELSGP